MSLINIHPVLVKEGVLFNNKSFLFLANINFPLSIGQLICDNVRIMAQQRGI